MSPIRDSVAEFYFAYGSNLWIDQMIRRTGSIDRSNGWPRRGTLAGYRFNYSMRSDEGEFFANIEPAEDLVLGVVYRVSPTFLDAMDPYETGYHRHPVVVTDERGESVQATTYIADEGQLAHGGRPTVEYLERVLRGAREFDFPDSYLRQLQSKGSLKS